MSVDPLNAAAESQLAGKTYYFCSVGCAQQFSKEPEKFLAAPRTEGIKPVSYTHLTLPTIYSV